MHFKDPAQSEQTAISCSVGQGHSLPKLNWRGYFEHFLLDGPKCPCYFHVVVILFSLTWGVIFEFLMHLSFVKNVNA